MVRLVLILAVLMSLSGCASTTYIYSEPTDAQVSIDNEVVGTTPVAYTELVYVWTRREVRIARKGFRTRTFEVRGEGPLSPVYATLCLCTAGLFLPVLFVSEFERELHVVPLESMEPPKNQPLIIDERIDFKP